MNKTTEIGGMGFAPTVSIAPDPKVARLEEALKSIRTYAFSNKLTGERLEKIFQLGLDAEAVAGKGNT